MCELGHSPVVVGRSQVIDASPELVWSLLSSPQVWSLRPASFAFEVAVPVAGRHGVMLGLGVGGPVCVLYEIVDEVWGQVIGLSMPGALPRGRDRLTFSAVPQGHGTRVTMTASTVVPRGNSKSGAKAYWRGQLKTWLSNLSQVLKCGSPWPSAAMTPGLRQACSPVAPLRSPAEVSASVLVRAPADRVWEVVYEPESALLTEPGHVICAGRVPGTPTREVGEMQYFVHRGDDGQLHATAIVVTEITDQHRALVSSVTRPHNEVLHLVTPVQQGTHLQFTHRWSSMTPRSNAQRRPIADAAQAAVEAYKKVIENADPPGS